MLKKKIYGKQKKKMKIFELEILQNLFDDTITFKSYISTPLIKISLNIFIYFIDIIFPVNLSYYI